jgi:hypothetical protein
VLGRPGDDLWVRLVETACWVMGVILVFGFINLVAFEAAEAGSWQSRVPRCCATWWGCCWSQSPPRWSTSSSGVGDQGALAALGVSSIVVGLALQEPLGNLFSGLVLLMERPFEVGDDRGRHGLRPGARVNWRSAPSSRRKGWCRSSPTPP